MATGRRSEVVAIGTLSKWINKAVALAAKRHDVVFGGDNIIYNWEILGRILREMQLGGHRRRTRRCQHRDEEHPRRQGLAGGHEDRQGHPGRIHRAHRQPVPLLGPDMPVNSTATCAPAHGYDCPSAQPDMEGARPFGVISGTVEETRIAFFKKSALDGFDWRAKFSTKDATRVFRFGARCEENRCSHFNGTQCSLGDRVKNSLPAVVDTLPTCLIRPRCRWYSELQRSVPALPSGSDDDSRG